MMIYPPIAELVEKAGSRYALVIEAAQRARQLSQGAEPLCEVDSNKEVAIAASEIFEGKICAVPKDEVCSCCANVEAETAAEPANDEDSAE